MEFYDICFLSLQLDVQAIQFLKNVRQVSKAFHPQFITKIIQKISFFASRNDFISSFILNMRLGILPLESQRTVM